MTAGANSRRLNAPPWWRWHLVSGSLFLTMLFTAFGAAEPAWSAAGMFAFLVASIFAGVFLRHLRKWLQEPDDA